MVCLVREFHGLSCEYITKFVVIAISQNIKEIIILLTTNQAVDGIFSLSFFSINTSSHGNSKLITRIFRTLTFFSCTRNTRNDEFIIVAPIQKNFFKSIFFKLECRCLLFVKKTTTNTAVLYKQNLATRQILKIKLKQQTRFF